MLLVQRCALAAVSVVALALVSGDADAQPRDGLDCHKRVAAACFDSKTLSLPTSLDQFLGRRTTMARDPWQAATLVVHALLVRETKPTLGDQMLVLSVTESRLSKAPKPMACSRRRIRRRSRATNRSTRKSSRRARNSTRRKRTLRRLRRRKKKPYNGRATYKGWLLGRRERRVLKKASKRPECARSLAKDTSPATGYAVDPARVTIVFRRRDTNSGSIEGGRYRVLVCSTGRDHCAPLWMVRNPRGIWKAETTATLTGKCAPITGKVHPAVADL